MRCPFLEALKAHSLVCNSRWEAAIFIEVRQTHPLHWTFGVFLCGNILKILPLLLFDMRNGLFNVLSYNLLIYLFLLFLISFLCGCIRLHQYIMLCKLYALRGSICSVLTVMCLSEFASLCTEKSETLNASLCLQNANWNTVCAIYCGSKMDALLTSYLYFPFRKDKWLTYLMKYGGDISPAGRSFLSKKINLEVVVVKDWLFSVVRNFDDHVVD